MALPMILNMCQFTQDGERKYGEYVTLDNGEGVCMIPSMDEPEEVVFVQNADGSTADGISDFMMSPVPCSIEYDPDAKHGDVVPEDVRESMSRTNFILEQYETGVMDEQEAGEALYEHLFGKGRKALRRPDNETTTRQHD